MTSLLQQGLTHHQAGRLAEAERCYRQVLAADPADADAVHLLGVLALQVRQLEPAVQLIQRAIALNPRAAYYHNNLGNAYRAMGRRVDAAEAFRRTVELAPQYADGNSNYATALRELARFGEAVEWYQRALKLNPKLPEALANLGTALKDQGRVDEAIESYRRALAVRPTFIEAHTNLLYALHASDAVTPDQLYREHLEWARRYADPLRPATDAHANGRDPERRLRVGYVSSDLRNHPVPRFLWPLIAHRDRERFEVICYCNADGGDEVTEQYARAVDAFHWITGMPDAQVAERVRADGIDILVDLTGHTNGSRLLTFARHPAPVQFTYLGYPDTTGLRAIDYRITDDLCDPAPGADALHAERLVRVPGCFLCYPLRDDLPPVTAAPVASNGRVTFASFNNLSKISPTTVRLWARVLAALPDARMIVKATSLGDARTRAVTADRLRRLGMPMDRVELLGPERTQSDHLATYGRVDIALDPFPYNGTTTTCEALSMGVPVVSLAGNHHASRVGLSLLSAAGIGEWATADADRYVQLAVELASDAPRLAAFRETMRARLAGSTLCDARAFAPKVERIYRDAWRAWTLGSTA